MPGQRYCEKIGREQLFLELWEQKKDSGAIITQGGKKFCVPLEIEGQVQFFEVNITAKRQFKSGENYNPYLAIINREQQEQDKKLFKISKKTSEGNVISMEEFARLRAEA